jgi:AcrR family transcriptional regulator
MGRPKLDIDVDDILRRQFRQKGYDGLSLAALAQETGLQKASLYYRFPEGKDSMARAALNSIGEVFEAQLFIPLRQLPPAEALALLEQSLSAYYEEGRLGCLLGAFAVPATAERFRPEMQALLAGFKAGLAELLGRLGIPAEAAQERGEDFISDLEGSLILASIAGDGATFTRRLKAAVRRLGPPPLSTCPLNQAG